MLIIFFYFLKIIFDINTSKRSKNYKPYSNLTKKKILKFNKKIINTMPNMPNRLLNYSRLPTWPPCYHARQKNISIILIPPDNDFHVSRS